MSAAHRDRVAVVTGAARGIGRAVAVRLAREGCHVAVADLATADAVARDIEGLGRKAHTAVCDLASPESIQKVCGEVLERFGRCDVLVNNAAYQAARTLGELDLATWRRFQSVNVDAAYLLCAALVPGMVERGFGRIVNIVSNTVWNPPRAGFLAYVTSKAGMLGFTRALAAELGEAGVTVNAVAPGLTRTPGAQAGNSAAVFEGVRQQQAIKRNLQPDDLTGTVAFLTSDDAAMITGQAIRVDAGLVTL